MTEAIHKSSEAVKRNWKTTKVVVKNLVELVDAVALAAVAGFAIYSSLGETANWYKALLGAGVLIAVQATLLLVRHFNKK